MAIERFEDLVAWQRAILFGKNVHGVMAASNLGRDRVLSDQLWRAVVSTSSNIAEGFEKYTRPEFGRFLGMAKASAGEARSQLHLAATVGLISKSQAENLISESEEVSRIIGGLRASLSRRKND